jgi:hypothetical protein
MSDSEIIIILIFLFILLAAIGMAWLLFFHFPKVALSIARELAEAVKNTLGITPQVTINQRIIYKQTRDILELAMNEQDYDVEYQEINKRWGSKKQISLHGIYRAKIGFDLQKGFQIEVHREKFFKPSKITVYLPRAEILSMEPMDIQKTYSSGFLNRVTNEDLEKATKQLTMLAMDKASKLEILTEAERRIENRLNEFLLPRLISYRLGYTVEFLETRPNDISLGEVKSA